MTTGVEASFAHDEPIVIPPSSRLARWVYGVSIPAVCVGVVFQVWVLAKQTSLPDLPLILMALLLGAALADLVTAAVHWACDTYGSSRTRWLGASLIHAFRVHHVRPRAMLAHDALDVNGGASAAIFALLLGYGVLCGASSGSGSLATMGAAADSPLVRATLLGFAVVAASANQLHAWAHAARPPRLVRRLQRFGVLLSKTAHSHHHRAPHTGGYCISLGWLNRPLDAVGFWRRFEHAIERVFGVAPRIEPGPAAIASGPRETGAVRRQNEFEVDGGRTSWEWK